ncbi:MAG: Alpha/beta hydrolase family protein [Pelotomaculum sp. PtaU1.Bin035]|nr:MAG: Alpha/beta hydrolase family protein [Pelotomaculum sp. PtaU1.Bin035]
MRRVETIINNDTISLEACLDLPDLKGCYPGVVLCHPHPLYGGNMNNNVILAVSRALTREGAASLRFNFRGVGRSQGSFGGGVLEQDDARAALSYLVKHEEINPARVGIMGYSFGGVVALPVGGGSSAVKAIAGVSPVITTGVLKDCVKPKLIICGAEDNIVPSSLVLRGTADMAEPKIVEVIPGVDHFWWGCEKEAADMVADFFVRILNRAE